MTDREATPAEIHQHLRDDFTAEFLGMKKSTQLEAYLNQLFRSIWLMAQLADIQDAIDQCQFMRARALTIAARDRTWPLKGS